jgi:hypothetical protein
MLGGLVWVWYAKRVTCLRGPSFNEVDMAAIHLRCVDADDPAASAWPPATATVLPPPAVRAPLRWRCAFHRAPDHADQPRPPRTRTQPGQARCLLGLTLRCVHVRVSMYTFSSLSLCLCVSVCVCDCVYGSGVGDRG